MTSQWKVIDKNGRQTVEVDKDYAFEKIRAAIIQDDWTRSTADAFCNQILQSMLNGGKGWRLDRPETLIEYIQAANLPMDAQLNEALDAAFNQSRYIRCGSYDSLVLAEAYNGGYVDPKEVNLLASIVSSLGAEQSWTRNLRGKAELSEQQRLQRRAKWISIISQDGKKTQYPVWRPEHGQVRYYDCSTLEGEDDANLEALATNVVALRAQMAGVKPPALNHPRRTIV